MDYFVSILYYFVFLQRKADNRKSAPLFRTLFNICYSIFLLYRILGISDSEWKEACALFFQDVSRSLSDVLPED